MMGGAVGLAALASAADARTGTLLDSGEGTLSALTGGYHVALLLGALFALAAAVIGGTLLRESGDVAAHGEEPAPGASPAAAEAC
jgi:hypothetical protein